MIFNFSILGFGKRSEKIQKMASKQFGLTLVCLLLVLLLEPQTAESRILNYKWEVKSELKSPDCFKKLTMTINGRSPGPTIYAHQGDTVIVDLKNGFFTENVAIHWHGIRQIGTPWSDGTEGVTQCPILPGETFRYQFVVDRPGTYLYHAHYGMQREDGLFGSIIVFLPEGQSEPFSYDRDLNLILTDWYHKTSREHEAGLAAPGNAFTWVGEPDSLLIQGRGRFNCSSLGSSSALGSGTCNSSSPDCVLYPIAVVPTKTYRLRVSSLTSLSALSFQIEGHNMTVVEADGHYVEPFEVKNLFIYSGETYSVLIKADQDPSRNYWITTNVVSRNSTTPPGLAILNYYPNHQRQTPPTPPPPGPAWNALAPRLAQSHAIKARRGFVHAPPKSADKVIVLLNTQNTVNNRRRWSLNNVSFNLPHTPYLVALKHNLLHAFNQAKPPTGYDFKTYDIFAPPPNPNATVSDAIYRLGLNSTVDVILQNANMMAANSSETHPWHLHGHDFWVLGYGEGKFDVYKDPERFNLVNPIMKNTVPLHPFGWTAMRFVADNPGVWAFHCHIDAHFFMGMGVVFEEGIEKVGTLPTSIMGCGESKRFLRP